MDLLLAGEGRALSGLAEYWVRVLADADLHMRGLDPLLEMLSLQRFSSRVELLVVVEARSDQ